MDFAFYDVMKSSKEILKNKQRHLYCNTLDLLATTSKSLSLVDAKVALDDVSFWLSDILPLTFDEDIAIQSNALAALENGFLTMDMKSVHDSSHWPELRNAIILVHAPLIHKLREARNPHWHTIWCLLVRILDRDILKGASTINSFLSIVELGFRSFDNNVRAEAFACWRLLIQIFSAYGQLSSPKRMKLICIPLKSSQSKTPHAAGVKLRVWWYFLTCLSENLQHHYESVVEPFLVFIFGAPGHSVPGVAQQYTSLQQLALPCLASLMSIKRNDNLRCFLNEMELENLIHPSPLTITSVLAKHWKLISNTAFAAIKILLESDTENNQQLLQLILRYLLNFVLRLDNAPFCAHICTEIVGLLPTYTRPIIFIINTIATEELILQGSLEDLVSFSNILDSLIQLLIVAKTIVPPAIHRRSIDQIFTLNSLQSGHNWSSVTTILDLLCQAHDDEDYASFETKVLIWRRVSYFILDNERQRCVDYHTKEYYDVIARWVLWPLRSCVAFAGHRTSSIFDMNFCTTWRQLINLSNNFSERQKFLNDLNLSLQELLNSRYEESYFADIFDAYVAAVEKFGFSKVSKHLNLFILLNDAMTKTLSRKTMQSLLNTLRNIIINLKQQEISILFETLKSTIQCAMRAAIRSSVETSFFEEWKRVILEKLRLHSNKKLSAQIKELFKGNDVYVIIPSVWSLDPEKLTERQKERFAEKANIPALYNDMSQSQESSIKPWTPKKIVIAKANQAEIVIESSNRKGESSSDQEQETRIAGNNGSIHANNEIYFEESASNQILKSRIKNTNKEEVKLNTFTAIGLTSNDKSLKSSGSPIKQRLTSSPSKNLCDDTFVVSEDILPKSELQIKQQSKCCVKPMCCQGEFTNAQISTMVVEKANGVVAQENQRYTKYCEVNNDKQFPPTEEQSLISSVLNISSANSELNLMKETSPKKILLLSPPDRKHTNNSISPRLRPKPSGHLTGRGAQLINMIRNKKNDTSSLLLPASTSVSKLHASTGKAEVTDNALFDVDITGTDLSTPTQPKDLLVFSKRLPSASASPSASILKRNMRHESIEDMDSPACKRKRVSFHDPPVSLTKEYVRDSTENKPKRCLALEKICAGQSSELKQALKRRSKLDSIIEIEKLSLSQSCNSIATPVSTTHKQSYKVNFDVSTSPLTLNEIDDMPNSSKTAFESFHETFDRSKIKMKDNADMALNFVTENYSLDQVLKNYLSTDESLKLKSATTLTKIVSNCMSENSKIKENVLETLSENHSKDFLDHAVQENLATVVCDRLNLNSVLDYICAKSKINSSCRNNLFLQIPEILKHSKIESERFQFIKNLLQINSFSDGTILDLITTLMRMRSTSDGNSTNVSESAIDSSSNL